MPMPLREIIVVTPCYFPTCLHCVVSKVRKELITAPGYNKEHYQVAKPELPSPPTLKVLVWNAEERIARAPQAEVTKWGVGSFSSELDKLLHDCAQELGYDEDYLEAT